MAFEREYAELAAYADLAGPEAPAWTLATAADRSLLFRMDIEQPFQATLAVGELELWTLRLRLAEDNERDIRIGMPGDYEGVLRNVGLALLETGEELRAAQSPGDLEFIAAALNWSLSVDQKPVIAAPGEALGHLLIAAGSDDEGLEMFAEYAIPALRAIGQDQRAAALELLTR